MPRNPGTGVYEQPLPDVYSGTTIESAVYNGFVNDVETDLNASRPIVAGGTGATDATTARANLKVEVSTQQVTNYDIHVWEAGSFWSATGATGAPLSDRYFLGTAYMITSADITLEARELVGITPRPVWYRQKQGGNWGTWTNSVEMAGSITTAGDINIDHTNPTLFLTKDGPSDASSVVGQRGTSRRWVIMLGDNTTETGSDVGSDFLIYRYNDLGGVYASPVFRITRSTGVIALGGQTYVNDGTSSPTTGTLHLGNSTTKGIAFDGVDRYTFYGGDIYTDAAWNINGQNLTARGTLSVTGTATITGALTAGSVTSTGALSAASASIGGTLSVTSTATITGALTAGSVTSTGALSAASASIGGALTVGSITGGLNLTGNLAVTGTIVATSTILGVNTVTAKAFNSSASPAFSLLNEAGGSAGGIYWDRPSDEVKISQYAGITFRLGNTPGTGNWVASSSDLTYKPSGGAWQAGSDARIKDVHGDYQHGLEQVLALHPVVYSYKGNDQIGKSDEGSMHSTVTDKEFVGLVAQECETVMPELVSQVSGFIDGQAVTDLRVLDSSALIYALINSVKTLTARIEALEAAQTAP